MATKEEVKVPATVNPSANLPAHLQGGKKAKLGNLDNSDRIVPRVKLLQAISPEVAESNQPGAKAGVFWHTLAGESLGERLKFVPIVIRKTIALWSPRNDDRGILARSSDCIHWDPGYANLQFEVKPKGAPRAITINTGDDVAGSFVVGHEDGPGLGEFGSSVPGDPQSAPMASLTYNMLMFFPDFPDYSPAVVINTRSSVRRAKELINKIDMRPVEHFGQMWEMYPTDEKGDEGPYKGYGYIAKGYVEDPAMFAHTKQLFEAYGEKDWVANDEADEVASAGNGAPKGDANSSKV